MFSDRRAAGKQLVKELAKELDHFPAWTVRKRSVIGAGSGGVLVAEYVALGLHAPLNAIAIESIPSMDSGLISIGSVCSPGIVVPDGNYQSYLMAENSYVPQTVRKLLKRTAETEQRWRSLAGLGTRVHFDNDTVVLVQDAVLRPGASQAALLSMKNIGAGQVILATPIILAETKTALESQFDLVFALETTAKNFEIEDIYQQYEDINDLLVAGILRDTAFCSQRDRELL